MSSKELCPCGSVDKAVRQGLCRACRKKGVPTIKTQVDNDRAYVKLQQEHSMLKLKYSEAIKRVESGESKLSAFEGLSQGIEIQHILPQKGSGTNEAVVSVVASDWHVEEGVGDEMSGLNRYNLDIAETRIRRFWESSLRLTKLLQQDVTISTVILALLGDFITGQIHGAENAEKNGLLPNDALLFAQARIIAGIEMFLNYSKVNLIVPCHSGNHARTTKTTRFSAENGHSLEYLMYMHLAAYFRNEKRITFIIPSGHHSYVSVYGETIRFHHGHTIRSAGGIGGIYPAVYKKIDNWNKARNATLDVFGHHHQTRDGGNFLANGSLIGYNGFAMSMGCSFEEPKQTLFLIDKKRGRTCTWPIFVDSKRP